MIGARIKFLPKGQQGEGLLPWVIAVMLFLTTLALASALALGGGLDRWSAALTTTVTIQIVDANDASRDATTEGALRMLRATPGVAEADVLADARVMDLIAPWVGDIPSNSNLPIPTLIEVTLVSPDSINITALKSRLTTISPTIRVDDHQSWMAQIYSLASMLRVILAVIVLMIAMSTIAIVIFGCRAGLATHRESIEIMHLIGAEDNVISKAFDELYLIHGLKGGSIGVLIAALALLGLSSIIDSLGQGLITALAPTLDNLWWFALLPIATGITTMMTARLTVRRALLKLM